MKRKKRRTGRAHLPPKKKRAIRRRLHQLCGKDKLDYTHDEFGALFGRSQNATDKWFYRDAKNSIPEVDVLVSLSRDYNVSLHWLLLGLGEWYREPPTQEGPTDSIGIEPPKQPTVTPSPTGKPPT